MKTTEDRKTSHTQGLEELIWNGFNVISITIQKPFSVGEYVNCFYFLALVHTAMMRMAEQIYAKKYHS